jgi:hypothetical protein
MTFHPRRFAYESGLHFAGRSLPVMAGGILVFVGGLLTAIAVAVAVREPTSADRGSHVPAVVLAATVPVLASGAAVLARGLRRVAAALRLAREGTRVEGTVLSVRASAMTVNHRTQVIVRFRYRDAAGAAHEGDSWPTEPAEGWKAGDTGVVRYDPSDPAAALWVGRER